MINPTKSYYRIREVVELLDVPAYTLRFWEDEFPMFNPDRTPSGQRRFTPDQVDMARLIKELLYERGMKIGAAIKWINTSYRKCPPRKPLVCKSKEGALKLLKSVKDTQEDPHSIARIEAVINWILSFSHHSNYPLHNKEM